MSRIKTRVDEKGSSVSPVSVRAKRVRFSMSIRCPAARLIRASRGSTKWCEMTASAVVHLVSRLVLGLENSAP